MASPGLVAIGRCHPFRYPVKICLLATVASIVVLDVVDHALDLTEAMNKSGSFSATRSLGVPARSALSMTALGGALCNDARLIDEGDDRYHTLGDPTEGALVVSAAKMGYWKSSIDVSFPRTA